MKSRNRKRGKKKNSSLETFLTLVRPPPNRSEESESTSIVPPPTRKRTLESFISEETTIDISQSITTTNVCHRDNIDPFASSNEFVKSFSHPNNYGIFAEDSVNMNEITPNFMKWKKEIWFNHFNQPRTEEEIMKVTLSKQNPKQFKLIEIVKPQEYSIECDFEDNLEKNDILNIELENDLLSKWNEYLHSATPKIDDMDEEEEEGEDDIATPLNYFGFRSPLQKSLCRRIFEYRDVLFACSDSKEESDYQAIQESFILHINNHLTKTKRYQFYNDQKRRNLHPQASYDARDRGFFRPSVLILVPYKHDAFRIINNFKKLVPDSFSNRFEKDEAFNLLFGESYQKKNLNYRSDWRKRMFEGNLEDSFCVGVRWSKFGNIELMVKDEYNADLIIATPLGLQSLFKKKKKSRDEDDRRLEWILSSIEICVVVRAEILAVLQNWEVFMKIWTSLNKSLEGRTIPNLSSEPGHVRSYFVHGKGEYFRQNLIFCGLRNVDIESIFWNSKNLRGKARITNPNLKGAMQIKHRPFYPCQAMIYLSCPLRDVDQTRYDVFTKKIVPQIFESNDVFLVIVSNYYEFARIRAFLTKEAGGGTSISISDYDNSYAKTLHRYRSEKTQIILYSERHYLTTARVKLSHFRATQYLFYSPPSFPHLYRRVLNHSMESIKREGKKKKGNGNNRRRKKGRNNKDIKIRMLWSLYDRFKMERCFGMNETKKIIQARKKIYHIV